MKANAPLPSVPARVPGLARIRIVLADDHDLVRAAIKALLSLMEGAEVIAEAREGGELIQLVDDLKPDIVMTDISMPPGMDGIAAISEIHARHPRIPVLVLSMYDTLDFVRRAVACGASGYLMKDASPFELDLAVRSVMNTGAYFSSSIAQRLLQPAEPAMEARLTARQVEILTQVAQGRASKEIAFKLGLSAKTVDVHRARIMERLCLNDIASLTRYALREGLIHA
jgi:DNA-binding NarL/FixJ family response regulator